MKVNNDMITKIKKEWEGIEPHNHYITLIDHKFGYSLGCFFSVADFREEKKIVFSITNLSSEKYQIVSRTSVRNVELIENLFMVIRALFPELTFEGFREIIFDILDESVVPVLKKYQAGFPSGFQLLEASEKVIANSDSLESLSTYISYQDVEFNYKMVPIIEDIIRKGEGC
ncbi:MAG: hypothetical protein U9Q88_00190 [Bacillota bacterium]|nr:hypothetical protein [Bacillota bacterium]